MHFAFLGPESQWAGEASECAAEQGAFWEYHDYLFSLQLGEIPGGLNQENLKSFAVDIGLNADTFNACMDSGKYAGVVQEETAWTQSLGVRSTPSFIVNGKPLIGAQPFEIFQQVFEAELGQ